MEKLKLDKTKLKRVSTYAKECGVDRNTIYNWAKEKKVRIETIDGVKFVHV